MEALLRLFIQSCTNSGNIDMQKVEKLNSTIQKGIDILENGKTKESIAEYMEIHQQSRDIMKELYPSIINIAEKACKNDEIYHIFKNAIDDFLPYQMLYLSIRSGN